MLAVAVVVTDVGCSVVVVDAVAVAVVVIIVVVQGYPTSPFIIFCYLFLFFILNKWSSFVNIIRNTRKLDNQPIWGFSLVSPRAF